MERIRRVFPAISQFAAPERLLLIDFWTDSEEARAQGDNAISQMGPTLCSLRANVEHHKCVCTEEQIYELPKALLSNEFDGLVILPPLARDRGTRDILSALLVRQQAARHTVSDERGLFTEGEPTADEGLSQFWSNAPRVLLKQRDLGAFIITLALSAIPDGTAVTVMGLEPLLSVAAMRQLRETIQRENSLRFVMELGDRWPGTHQGLHLAAVMMESGRTENPLVRLFKVPTGRGVNLDDVSEDLQRLCSRQGGTTQYGYVMRSGLPANSSWRVEAHHPRWEQYLSELREIGEVKSLLDLGQLIQTMSPPDTGASSKPTDWPVLHPRQITSDGLIDVDELENARYWPEEPQRDETRLRSGDVVIRKLHALSDTTSPIRLSVVHETDQPWYLGLNMLLFRFREDIEPALRQYVLAYLRSSEAAAWLRSRSLGILISMRLLEELPIPVPDDSVLAAFSRLRQTHDQFRTWAQQLQDVEDRLFSFSTPREACKELLEVSARAQQRIVAARATETLSWRIRNLYPHPLAFRWRTIEIQKPGVEKYLEILRAAEVCVAYTAIVGCALSENLGAEFALESVAKQAGALRKKPGTGVTFWTWVSIIDELNRRRFRELDPTTPFQEVTQIYKSNPELKEVINSLMGKRNDMAHDRGPSEFELDKVLAVTEAELEALFESVDFLSRYPLRNISYTRRVGRLQRGTYSCQDLVGDHPVPANRNVEFEGETPAEGVNLVDQIGKPHFIEPWLVRRRCQKCHHEETYILDRYMRDGVIMLKSLEHGHESDASDLRDELKSIGIDLPGKGS